MLQRIAYTFAGGILKYCFQMEALRSISLNLSLVLSSNTTTINNLIRPRRGQDIQTLMLRTNVRFCDHPPIA